jgi:outer membrane protein TolC
MANKIVEDTFREVQDAVAKLRQVIDQHEALQHDLVKTQQPAEKKAEPPKK